MEIPNDGTSATTLLYVEDDAHTQEIVIQIVRLKFPRISLLLAQNGQEGLDLYAKHRPGIVVTDVRMPVMDGIQMAKKIKELHADVQIIVLSASDESSYILEAIDIGINNYVLKPIDIEKFVAALERCLDRISLTEQLKQKEEHIRQIAYYDCLTGLPNRQLFSELLHKSVAHTQRYKRLLSLLYLDLDEFKKINDTLGHAVGDQLLKEVAQRLKMCCCRDQDMAARWGGDEFIILLPEVDGPHQALILAQKINAAFAQPIFLPDHTLTISISIGISHFPDDGIDGDTLIKSADLAMYRVKHAGRNHFTHHRR